MGGKAPGVFRLAFQNIGRLPVSSSATKSKATVAHLVEGQYDLFLMAEVGLCHCKLRPQDQWGERIVGLMDDSSAYFAYNTSELDKSEAAQFGGVGIIASAEARHRIIRSEKDPSGLGRWVSVSLQGKEGHVTTCFSVYRPCNSTNNVGSVFMQHVRRLPSRADPRQAVFEDLKKAILTAKDRGDHILVGMDANDNVLSDPVKSFFSDMGLREIVTSHHFPLSPPETQRRNQQRLPIDGLWASHSISAIRCGYSAYDEGIPSDHRCLWMDIQFSIVFGQRCPPMSGSKARRLKASDPRLVKKYVKALKKVIRLERLDKRLQEVRSKAASSGWSSELEEEFNSVHGKSLKLRKSVEARLRKLPMGIKPWSPKLQLFRDRITLWEMMVRRRKREKVSFSRIRRFMKKTGVDDAIRYSLEEALVARDVAYKEYKAACLQAENWRDQHQEDLISALAENNNTSRESELKKMRLREKQRRVSRQIKRARGKLGLGRVTKVYYNEGETKVECNTKKMMDFAISKENELRFSQSEDTPPMLSPLLGDMGFFGDTLEAAEVLAGSYPIPSSLPKYTQEFLRALQKPMSVIEQGDVSTGISVEEHCWAWKRQKERTSAEPTSPSFSHYKAAATDPFLAMFDVMIRELPYRYGFSPLAWRRITDVSILKKAGIFCVEQMRTIQLMFAEFNINNKKLGRDVMKSAEKAGIIPWDQYGSRKKHRCIMAALNKRLTMDILRQLVLAGALCANDAKSCYDRIVHWVAVLALCWAGLPKEPAVSMFSTLAFAVHFVSTAFGISARSYGGGRLVPLQGVGQGNGSGPAVWAVISAVLIRMMYAAGHGAHIISPISWSLVSFVCYAFVDDTDIIEVGRSVYSSGESVANSLQEAVDRWEGGLRATGGALVPGKSHWYLVDFLWNGSKWIYRSCSNMPASLSVLDTNGAQRVTLTRHEVWHAEETLGVKLSMDGNNEDQVNLLCEKVNKLVDQLRGSNLAKNNVWYSIERVIMPSVGYCLPAVTLSRQQWDKVIAPVLKYLLPKSGVDSHFPRRILFAPVAYQGTGLEHPWHSQEISHLCTLVSECMRGSLTGKLLQTSLEACRLEAGVSGQFWDYQFEDLKPCITKSWISDLWSYTSAFKIKLVDPFPVLSSFWSEDCFLMDAFALRYSGEDLRRLNHCRMFLQSVTLSDLSTMDGCSICHGAWYGIPGDSWSEYAWPRRPPSLPSAWWDLWQQALVRCFCKGPGSRVLRRPLGVPLAVPSRWRWFHSASTDRVYHRQGALWKVFSKRGITRTSRRRLQPRYMDSMRFDLPPDDLQAVRVVLDKGSKLLALDGPSLYHREFNCTPKSSPAESPDRVFVAEWEMLDGSISQLAEAISLGKCLVVSDGSYKDGRCTAAFTLQSQVSAARCVGVNSIPGNVTDNDSFRGEVGGVLGALELIRWICEAHQVKSGSLTLSLDGEEALESCSDEDPISPDQASFDLLQVVKDLRKKIPVKIHWEWVRGHQTGGLRSQASLLNDFCDKTAKAYWQHCQSGEVWVDGASFGEGWQIWLGRDKLCSLNRSGLYEWAVLFDSDLSPQEYWEGKHQIPREDFHHVDWDSIKHAMKSLPQGRQRWLSKFLTGFCGTNQRLHFRGISGSECPRCEEPVEDSRHVVKCQGTGASIVWASAMVKLEDCLISKNSDPAIIRSIKSRLQEWYYGDSVVLDLVSLPKRVRKAVTHQDRLGWNNFLYGRLSCFWGQAQYSFYKSCHSRSSVRRWSWAIIQKLWDVSWDMWSHRNEIKMHPNHPSQAVVLQNLRSQILRLCSHQHADWNLEEKALLKVSPQQLALWSYNQLQFWLASHAAIRRRVKARQQIALEQTAAMRKFMRSWLQTGSGLSR